MLLCSHASFYLSERYEAVSPERARSPFTVQAPPIITMQTLMEIKTALQADDDGDLWVALGFFYYLCSSYSLLKPNDVRQEGQKTTVLNLFSR